MPSPNDTVEILLGLVLIRLVRKMSNRTSFCRPARLTSRQQLDVLLWKWNVFPSLRGRCEAQKSSDPIDPRIARLQERLGFEVGEPITKKNATRIILVGNYARVDEEHAEASRWIEDHKHVDWNGENSGQKKSNNTDIMPRGNKIHQQLNGNNVNLSPRHGKDRRQLNGLLGKREYRNSKIDEDLTPIASKKRRLTHAGSFAPKAPPKETKDEDFKQLDTNKRRLSYTGMFAPKAPPKVTTESWSYQADLNFKLKIRSAL